MAKGDSEAEKWEGLWIKDKRLGWWYANDGAMITKIITGIKKKSPEKEVLKSTKEKKLLQYNLNITLSLQRRSKSGRRKRKRRTHAAGKQAENVQEQRGK